MSGVRLTRSFPLVELSGAERNGRGHTDLSQARSPNLEKMAKTFPTLSVLFPCKADYGKGKFYSRENKMKTKKKTNRREDQSCLNLRGQRNASLRCKPDILVQKGVVLSRKVLSCPDGLLGFLVKEENKRSRLPKHLLLLGLNGSLIKPLKGASCPKKTWPVQPQP